MNEPKKSDPKDPEFIPEDLSQSVIALPLLKKLEAERNKIDQAPELIPVIIDLNLEYPNGRSGAMAWVVKELNNLVPELTIVEDHKAYGLNADKQPKNQYTQQYLF